MLMLHGQFSGLGLPANWIVVDIVRIQQRQLAEHWDVIEDQVTREKSTSCLSTFGAVFPCRIICPGEPGSRVVRCTSGSAYGFVYNSPTTI
jgi:hypothetical protein